MAYIVKVKHGETSFGFSCGSGSEADATAFGLLCSGYVDISITSPRGVSYKPAVFHQLISNLVEVDPGRTPEISSLRYESVGNSRVKQHDHRH